ncbi:hypothetical protein K1W54_11450 [Micromonospora sp. CPCC 205371]|nr:hypothetical protein [Micromonospora sp. CPCC 205371]
MPVARRPALDAVGVFLAAWLPLNPALGAVAVWLTSRRAYAAFPAADDWYFIENWSEPAAGILAFAGFLCVALSLLLVGAVRGKSISGALAVPIAWCAVLSGWVLTRTNPISINWGGDPDGYSLVRPYLAGWLEPALTVHLVVLAFAACAATALRLSLRGSLPTPR